jgi:hypothetical protein
LAVTQMIAEVKAMPETVAKRRVVTRRGHAAPLNPPASNPPASTSPIQVVSTAPAYNPFNMF